MDVRQIGQIFAQLDSPVWLVTAANCDRQGGFIATTVTQASIVADFSRQFMKAQYEHDAGLDAVAIRQWREQRD